MGGVSTGGEREGRELRDKPLLRLLAQSTAVSSYPSVIGPRSVNLLLSLSSEPSEGQYGLPGRTSSFLMEVGREGDCGRVGTALSTHRNGEILSRTSRGLVVHR